MATKTNERNYCLQCKHVWLPHTTVFGLPAPYVPLCGHTAHWLFDPVQGPYRQKATDVRKEYPLCCPRYEPKEKEVVTPPVVRVTLWQRVRAWFNL